MKDKEMYDLKHDLIALQIQNETLKKEMEQAQAERKLLEEENARLSGEVDELLKG